MSNEQMSEVMRKEYEELKAADAKRKDAYKVWGERYRVRMILFKIKAEKAGIRVSDDEVEAEIAKKSRK